VHHGQVVRREDVADAPPSAVWAKLADARGWNAWRAFPNKLVGAVTAAPASLTPGDRLGLLASPGILGVLPLPTRATVTRAGRGVLSFEDDALFGLAAGTHTLTVRPAGLLGRRSKVTVEHATTGPVPCLLPAAAKERAAARWLLDLKAALE
jgi:hypothetical protein